MSSNGKLSSPLFNVRVDNGIAVLQAKDKAFLSSQAKEFSRLFEELKSRSIVKYILDFSNCDYVSSEGLNFTAQCWKWCREQGHGSMAAVVPNEPANAVRKLFDIIGMSYMIGASLQPTVADAEKYLRQGIS
jgi:anti-anti-sigma regulatory factor